MQLHGWSAEHAGLADELARRIRGHFRPDAPLGRTPAAADVAALAAITPDGLGVDGALALVDDVLLPNNVALDHDRFLAYIPAAPATAAALFDAVVGAWSFSGESWQEAGAAVAAENAALDWLRDARRPAGRGGRVLRQRRLGGQPQRPRRGPRRVAPPPRRRRARGASPARRPPTRRSAAPPRCSTSTSSTSPATSSTG